MTLAVMVNAVVSSNRLLNFFLAPEVETAGTTDSLREEDTTNGGEENDQVIFFFFGDCVDSCKTRKFCVHDIFADFVSGSDLRKFHGGK